MPTLYDDMSFGLRNNGLSEEEANKEIRIVARGYDAIVLQHEYDHLDGLFFYDRINKKDPNGQLPNEELI